MIEGTAWFEEASLYVVAWQHGGDSTHSIGHNIQTLSESMSVYLSQTRLNDVT